MPLYTVSTTRPYQRLFRILGWGAIIVLLGICLFSIYDPVERNHSTNVLLAWVAGAIVLGAVVGAVMLSSKEALWKVQRAFQWELTGEKIIQRHEDGTTREIPLTHIESLHEGHGWLIIRGGEPVRQISVPLEINGLEELKRELTAHCAVTPLKVKFSPLSFFPLVLAIAAYCFLFASHNRAVVMVAGAAALLLQGWAYYWVWRVLRAKPMPRLVMLSFVLSWLLLAWIVYQRTKGAL